MTISQARVKAIGRELASVEGTSGVFGMRGFAGRIMAQALEDPAFRANLFQLVDVFPALADADDVASHVADYLGDRAPVWMRTGQRLAERVPSGRWLLERVTRENILQMAKQFIVAEEPHAVVGGVGALATHGYTSTVDLLGEKVITAEESARYLDTITEIHDHLVRARPVIETRGPLIGPSVSISIKPSALSPRWSPLAHEPVVDEVASRLEPLLKRAQAEGSLVFLDMEHYDTYETTLAVFRRILAHPGLSELRIGIVLQAYLRRHLTELERLLAEIPSTADPRVWIRLVKGAYWDTEVSQAITESVDPPVFIDKADTDRSYERSVTMLLDAADRVHPAFASHNVRSLAVVLAEAEARHLGPERFEIQMLYGMAEPLATAVRRFGAAVRIYAPVGSLLPGMSYLVRRLLENTSNSSFVRHRFGDRESLDELLAPPRSHPASVVPPSVPPGYRHTPQTQYRHADVRAAQRAAIDALAQAVATTPRQVPARLGRERLLGSRLAESRNPAHRDVIVAHWADHDPTIVEAAVTTAERAGRQLGELGLAGRAVILERAAAYLGDHRREIVATEVLEAAKPWVEADNDVGEAIDFLHYYAQMARRLERADRLDSPPGERNRLRYRPRGVTAVIPPWNFPLAIPMGMTAAALVTGNPTILKPAEQTPLTASFIADAFEAAGLPDGALVFLPGRGETIGQALVEHPHVATIAFTGSKAVGLDIVARAATLRPGQRALKRVIAELGGKNAIIVDADADLDQAVPGVLQSAFGFAGQKCSAASRVVVHQRIRDAFVARLIEAAAELAIGDPRSSATVVPPVIDDEAQARILGVSADAEATATLAWRASSVPSEGSYVPPTIFVDPDHRAPLWRDEIFGPVLVVDAADDLTDAIERANDTDYALTQGIYSRSPSSIRRVVEHAHAGNVYVNRPITGAIPGRHPFGGFGHSGVGFKAGGPSYLLQFLDQQVVSENLIRQGFSPDIA